MPWEDLQRIRIESPLVHNITNHVVMNTTANALLALGASPVMAHALEEVREMAAMARAVVLNLGTLSPAWVEAMVAAGQEARERGTPVILDPVGCGATRYRTDTARMLLRTVRPTIVRGNASEIMALAADGAPATKGVDSTAGPRRALAAAHELVRQHGCVVSVSGPVDLVVGRNGGAGIANGHPLMARVTGTGCIASALTGAFAAVNADPLRAAVHAMTVTGVAGELAAHGAAGPGSFMPRFLDALHGLDETILAEHARPAPLPADDPLRP